MLLPSDIDGSSTESDDDLDVPIFDPPSHKRKRVAGTCPDAGGASQDHEIKSSGNI